MRTATRVLWIPPLFVGAAAAMSVSTSTAMLLYSGEGMVRAVGVIAVITALSLGLGVWTGARDHEREEIPSTARWWVGLLVALVFAAGFSGLWDAFEGFGATRTAQGTGLAVMTALPSYFAGGVLGRIGSFTESLSRGLKSRILLGAGAGMAIGSLAVTAALGRPVLAVTVFLGAAVIASLGARIQGWIFDRVPRRRVLLKGEGPDQLRFESWYTAVSDEAVRLLTRDGEPLIQDPAAPGSWQDGVSSTVDDGSTLVFIGAGSWFEVEDTDWSLYEPDPQVVALGSRGFGWSAASIMDGAVIPARGSTVVVDRACLDLFIDAYGGAAGLMQALSSGAVIRMWIGGVRAPLPDELVEAGAAYGYRVRGYSGRISGRSTPPRTSGRWERLWCFQHGGDWPSVVGGLTHSPVDGEAAP